MHKVGRTEPYGTRMAVRWTVLLWVVFMVLPSLFSQEAAEAQESLCAKVKLEIRQEATLERQAFDAHMRINNGLSHITLENIRVDVSFTDEEGNTVLATNDPNNSAAVFFIRLDTMQNINNVDGTGTVNPSTSADIHWLIIPAAGAANGLETGTRYYVGARLTYAAGGAQNVTDVAPDHIYVKPLPELTLDYFIPADVYGDDTFTPEIEPPRPFSLGVRAVNNGKSAARKMKIDSAQPRIVDNERGLLVGFVIEGCEVNGQAAAKSLLADFGDIKPNGSGVARWIMSCSLSGRFTAFSATFSHADELGGDLTSLVRAVNTHLLVRDVIVDLPGRDSLRDFLARDGGIPRVYESDGTDSGVTDQSVLSTLQLLDQSGSLIRYRLSAPPTAGFLSVKLPDPFGGQKAIREVVRSDGKLIRADNAWLSKTRASDHQTWLYELNLFDANTTGSYTLIFGAAGEVAQPPVLQFVPDRTGLEGRQLSFLVEAIDPNGTIPSLSASPLPAGARYTDGRDGKAAFDWTPGIGQAGRYVIVFRASDGTLEAARTATITIYQAGDTDGDGLADSWEMDHFGNLNRDGLGDFDGDGISDLEEFRDGTNPTRDDHAPTVPVIVSPSDEAEVGLLWPTLLVNNSTDADGQALTYEFGLFAAAASTMPVAEQSVSGQSETTTSWTVPETLTDNQPYFWRVRATDGVASSLWAYGSFFVNTANEAPAFFQISNPEDGKTVGARQPSLQVTNAVDPDRDQVTYGFEICTDAGMTVPVASVSGIAAGADGITTWHPEQAELLTNGVRYYWRSVATDEHGARTFTEVSSFLVNTGYQPPSEPAISAPAVGGETTFQEISLVVINSSGGSGARQYFYELDKVNTFDSPAKRTSGAIPEGLGTTDWGVAGLDDNTVYYWRVKTGDGTGESIWVGGRFFVNTQNDQPPVPTVRNPGANAWVGTLTPTLEVNPATDPDRDTLTYRFEIYADAQLTTVVAQAETSEPRWTVSAPLIDRHRYYWRIQVRDEHELAGEWAAISSFFVKHETDTAEAEVTVMYAGSNAPGVPVYLFSEAGVYWGISGQTDQNGKVRIALPNGAGFKFRGDILGGQYWSDVVQVSGIGTYPVSLDAGGGRVRMTVREDSQTPLAGLNVYLFSEAGAYLGRQLLTDTSGLAEFPVSRGRFKFRADHLGYQFWSEMMLVEETTERVLTITSTQVNVTVGGVFQGVTQPLEGIDVYLFSVAGSYLGLHQRTGNDGQVSFWLPQRDYKVRADYFGRQCWSDPFNGQDATVTVPLADAAVTVGRPGHPVDGVNVYVFSMEGSYLGLTGTTAGGGRVDFRLPAGTYKFRGDYQGRQYWSGDSVLLADQSNPVAVAMGGGSFTFTVLKGPDEPLPGVRCYVFSDAGAYLGLSGVTDGSGQVSFDLADGRFRIRTDYLGTQFWSDPVAVSGPTALALFIAHSPAEVAVISAGSGVAGVRVYVFNEAGAYLGIYGDTDGSGRARVTLPDGVRFKFRTDYLGYQFWSETVLAEDATERVLTITSSLVNVTVGGVFKGVTQPLEDIDVYLFSVAGSYLGLHQRTGSDGRVSFRLPQRDYKVRADYLGRQFWSDPFNGQDAAVTVPLADAAVTVGRPGHPVDGVSVYVFSMEGSYLGLTGTTTGGGRVDFRLPAGAYKFRADYQGRQYWSGDSVLLTDQLNPVAVVTGGGSFTFTVLKGPGEPLPGVRCYVFSEVAAYLGLSGVTDGSGQVSFDLADGQFKIRIDYMGTQFWSEEVRVPAVMSAQMLIAHRTVTVTVAGHLMGDTQPRKSVPLYLFSPAGAYLSITRTTGEDGSASFYLPEQSYKVRANYLNQEYWSGEFTWQDTPIPVPEGIAYVHVSMAGHDAAGALVYVYSAAGAYLGISAAANSTGIVEMRLPAGSYKFRADIRGNQYWTSSGIVADGVNGVEINGGGGEFVLRLDKGGIPLTGTRAYAFNAAGTYLGMYADSSATGQLSFHLPSGSYKFRVDYLGYQFWSDVYPVPDVMAGTVTIPHQDVTVTVEGLDPGTEPLGGVSVYLFTPSGGYLGKSQVTDATGRVVFNLPDQPYKVRVDYLGLQFWSATFRSQNRTVGIDRGAVQVHVIRAGGDVSGANVYLFGSGGSYLGQFKVTDAEGIARFVLPSAFFKFRTDFGGTQRWSGVIDVTAGQENPVEMGMD